MPVAESRMIGGVSEVTLLTPITPGLVKGQGQTYEQRLQRELDSVQRRVAQRIPTPIGVMSTIHFARWIILRPRQYLQYSDAQPVEQELPRGRAAPAKAESPREAMGDKEGRGGTGAAPSADEQAGAQAATQPAYRSWLLFTSNFDGDMKSYLRDFAVFLGDDVDRIWGNCEGWPAGGSRDFEHYWNYAKRHQIPTNAFYAAYPELSVPRIRQLERFKRAFDEFVASTRRPDGGSIADIASRFDEFLYQNAVYPSDFPQLGGTYYGLKD